MACDNLAKEGSKLLGIILATVTVEDCSPQALGFSNSRLLGERLLIADAALMATG